jgi:aminocarboxymuconate-semialdehyde decarboxylase
MSPDSETFTMVDMHCHIFPRDIPDLSASTGDPRWPRLVASEGDDAGEVRLGDAVFRAVRRPLWDTTARVAVMNQQHIGVQVVSPMPIALTYWSDADLALRYARTFNDQIAAGVETSGGRLRGLGTVPLQDPQAAIREMHRAMDDLHLSGIEIGTLVGRSELNHPDLRAFFREAAEHHVPLFVHPIDGSGATRCSSPIIDFAIGMHTDTALAGYALVYGGVLDELPELRVCLSHGGGGFPWTHPRLRLLDQRDNEKLDRLVGRLWADALVFDPQHLPLLVERFGADHLMLGSDYPFIPPEVHDPAAMLRTALEAGLITGTDHEAIATANAISFLER